jgi:hypothetical protein
LGGEAANEQLEMKMKDSRRRSLIDGEQALQSDNETA